MLAMSRAQNNMYNGNSWPIFHRHNTIKHLLSSRIIFIEYIRFKENIMDPLTKILTREQDKRTSRAMGLLRLS